jgi:hypothetical protein
MASNFPGLIEILPNINNSPLKALDPIELAKNLTNYIFPNLAALMETQFWAKFVEKHTMESPVKALLGNFNVDPGLELKNVAPGIFAGLTTDRGGKSH